MPSQDAIQNNLNQIRKAVYGSEVREALASGLEICYGYTSGDEANKAAVRANTAAATVEDVIDRSEEALAEIESAVANVDKIVSVSEEEPTETENKIWIQPQADTEYKVASFGAYEALWDRCREINETYQQGHGGIVSIVRDDTYEDPDPDPARGQKIRYVITYSDTFVDELFMYDGKMGDVGPVDEIDHTEIFYHKGEISGGQLVPTPPVGGWVNNLPALDPGDWLWTQTIVTYTSTAQAYIYGLSRIGLNGLNGSGAVNSIRIGENGTQMPGQGGDPDVCIPVDASPTQNSNNLITSGSLYTTLQNYVSNDSPEFTGTPTAPTPSSDDNSTRIATTAFVNSVASGGASAKRISVTINSASVTIRDGSITENTYCLFSDVDVAKFGSNIGWKTINGQLILTMATAPASSTTITIILLETTDS